MRPSSVPSSRAQNRHGHDVTLIVCATCKRTGDDAGGAELATAIEDRARRRPAAPRITRHDCLWACSRACTVLIQSPGKTGYLAGNLEPDAAAADALLDWSAAYAQSADGNVAYAAWPEGMKGHFIARMPPAEGAEG